MITPFYMLLVLPRSPADSRAEDFASLAFVPVVNLSMSYSRRCPAFPWAADRDRHGGLR